MKKLPVSRSSKKNKSTKVAADPKVAKSATKRVAAAKRGAKAKAKAAPKPADGDPAPERVAAAKSLAAPNDVTEVSFEPQQARAVVRRVRARWLTITDAERAMFDELSTDDNRRALGAKTRARGVAADATRWVSSLDRQLHKSKVLQSHYHPKRFVYFVERLDVLLVALGEQRTDLGARSQARSGAGAAAKQARLARGKLVLSMERYAGKRAAHNEALSAALDGGSGVEELGLEIQSLARLATTWLGAGPDALLEVSGLTPDLVQSALAAASALAEAGADAGDAGAVIARDTPEVNLVEGWVLEEMQRARADVEAARAEDGNLERLAPGAATRRLFGKHPKTAVAKEAKATPPPATTPHAAEPKPEVIAEAKPETEKPVADTAAAAAPETPA